MSLLESKLSALDELLENSKKDQEKVNITTRFEEAPWMEQMDKTVFIVLGLGNIGSWLSLFLSRFNPSVLSIVDNDIVEYHNMGGQFHSNYNIGKTKIESVINSILNYSELKINASNKGLKHHNVRIGDGVGEINVKDIIKANAHTEISNFIVFSCFDNMKAREHTINSLASLAEPDSVGKTYLKSTQNMYLIDGRSEAEHYQAFTVDIKNKKDVEKYKEEHIFPDIDIKDAPCNLKSTTHCGAQLASIMTTIATSILTNIQYEMELRPYPKQLDVNLTYFDFKSLE